MAGFAKDQADIDFRAGSLAVSLRNTFAEIERFKQFLDATPDQELEDLGYTSQEVAVLKSAFTDMNKLALIYNGDDIQAAPNDFGFWARQLMGVQ